MIAWSWMMMVILNFSRKLRYDLNTRQISTVRRNTLLLRQKEPMLAQEKRATLFIYPCVTLYQPMAPLEIWRFHIPGTGYVNTCSVFLQTLTNTLGPPCPRTSRSHWHRMDGWVHVISGTFVV